MAGDLPDVYLQFEGYTGSCQDSLHPGEEGWISLKSLTFGFGFPGKDKDDKKKKEKEEKDKQKAKNTPAEKPKPPPTEGMTSGPMTFDPIKFSKGADLMSHDLMKACKAGTKIKKATLHCCRYGGEHGDEKLPFVHMVFEDIYIKTCKVNLTSDGLPEESLEFVYETVSMTGIWTDNTTGKALGDTATVSWSMGDAERTEAIASED
jgi:type VI protein secretion system component Hcp